MDENKLYKSLIICVLVLASLSLGTFIPRIGIAGFELKDIDLFADIRTSPPKAEVTQRGYALRPSIFDITYLPYFRGYTRYLTASDGISSLFALPHFSVAEEERNKRLVFITLDNKSVTGKSITDMIQKPLFFEDFSPDRNSLVPFFKALNEIKKGKGKGRIAFFGDSFIEGDIFCADVRNALQDIFGGKGVGFVPITSEVAQFRTTIGHTFSGFNTFSLSRKEAFDEPLGVGGYCFTAGEENDVTYTVSSKYKPSNLFRNIKLFYTSPEKTNFTYRLSNGVINVIKVAASDQLQQKVLSEVNSTSASFNFPASDTIKLYGVSFEDSTGIYVDNFGMRGNSGLGLARITDSMNRQFNHFQDYRLIILQYGLNVVSTDNEDFSWYVNPMINVVNRLKSCYPEASILLMSVSDRSNKIGGKFQTMKSIPLFVEAQREIARKSQIAFFNLFEAMGGENSMVAFVDSNPSLANKDYTHLNFLGGRRVAGVFVDSLILEYQKYNDRIKKLSTPGSTPAVGSK
jgi:lysophospholipase L1-like esterase